MSTDLNLRYPNIFRFVDAYRGFEKFYQENTNPTIEFKNFLTKLGILDNFIVSIIENMDFENSEEVFRKIQSDPDFILKTLKEKINIKTKPLIEPNETSSDNDSDNDSSSLNSIEDINSKDSDSESEEENEDEKNLSNQTNKMLASSLIELKMRKRIREFDIEKIEE